MTNSSNLIMGFAFSLTADGSPGSYNESLASHLSKQLEEHQSIEGGFTPVVLQGELADALETLSPNLTKELLTQNKLFAVTPPHFLKSEVKENLFEDFLFTRESKYHIALQRSIETVTGGLLVERLNNLLNDANFYKRFSGLELNDLVRPNLGDLFTERRSLPLQAHYPRGLNRYQRVRVNRLIIESVIDNPEVLRQGRYLSTAGVIEKGLSYCLNHDLKIKKLDVVAHPLHLARCIEQTEQVLAARKSKISVHGDMQDVDIAWDSGALKSGANPLPIGINTKRPSEGY